MSDYLSGGVVPSTVFGWTMKQWMYAWTFFQRDVECSVDMDDSLTVRAWKATQFLLDLQSKWQEQFPDDPMKGPMQVYVPDVPAHIEQLVSRLWADLHAENSRWMVVPNA